MTINNSPTNIYLVDDDEEDYLIIKMMLAKIPDNPFVLSWTADYKTAAESIEKNEYSLYLIDYRLGEHDGFELLKQAQPYQRAEPFIILTGAGDEKIEQRAMRLGAADYLVKGTFNSELLSRTLRYALQRKLLEEQRVSHLLEVNRAKDEFISLASHQLRTPATGVKQYVGMILEGFAGNVPAKQRAMLEKAYESNERQLHIVADLLRVAQVDAGKVVLRRAHADIAEIICDLLRDQASVFKGRRQEIVFNKPKKPMWLNVDKYNMRMVLENLLDNASKYSPEGKTITVSISTSESECVISVADQGVGIKSADRKKLFEKFTRIENPLSTLVGGTGLGLYWAKKIVDLHGGGIGVESKLNKGSVFSVRLPLKIDNV